MFDFFLIGWLSFAISVPNSKLTIPITWTDGWRAPMANVMLTIISRSTHQSCLAGMRQLFLSGVITALKVAVLTNFESAASIQRCLDQKLLPQGRHVRRKFHPGHKCHSPHYRGPCLSIRPYLGESDVKLSHPSILPWDTIVMTIILMSLSLLALVQVW